MKNLVAICVLIVVLAGCSAEQWMAVASGSDKTASASTGVATVAENSSVVTGIYGETISIIALGVASIAAGIGGFARQRLKKLEAAE